VTFEEETNKERGIEIQFAHYIIELLHIVSYDSNYQKERDGITLTD
jgi:hypothetical protein